MQKPTKLDDSIEVPVMALAQWTFQLKNEASNAEQRQEAAGHLLETMQKHNMAPFYNWLLADQKIPQTALKVEKKTLEKWSELNQRQLEQLQTAVEEAEKNFGETEVAEALLERARFLCLIGDKEEALAAFRVAFDKATTPGARLDIVFTQLRIGIFYQDMKLIQSTLDTAKDLVEKGGDWDRRNRLKVYEGIHLLSIREFKQGAQLMLDGLATFTSTEIMEYKDFVKYVVLASAYSLPRSDIKKKILESPEILEVIHQIPHLEDFIHSLYYCRYNQFFAALASVESYLKYDRYLYQHYRWFTREMRILAYNQLLESYRSITIAAMAQAFGVSADFIDTDISKLVASGRLNCVIDKVGGIIETNRPDAKNAQYQQFIKQGDLLLNRIQKLSRVINV